jgi:hypothetical protein
MDDELQQQPRTKKRRPTGIQKQKAPCGPM